MEPSITAKHADIVEIKAADFNPNLVVLMFARLVQDSDFSAAVLLEHNHNFLLTVFV